MDTKGAEAALVDAAGALAAGDDLDAFIGRVAVLATEALGYDGALVYLLGEESETLQLAASAGAAHGAAATIGLGETEGAARAARERRAITTRNRRYEPLLLGGEGGAPAGVLEARGPGGAAGSAGALAALANLAAVAIERSRLRGAVAERSEWFERLSQIDPLTGLANRTTLDRAIEIELARAARQDGAVAIVLFDVVDLTGLTARLGRVAADDVLRRTAAVLTENVRILDTVARYGGLEFAVLAPRARGPALSQRIVAAADAQRLEDGTPIRLRSAMAVFPNDGTTGAELLAAAERALRGATV